MRVELHSAPSLFDDLAAEWDALLSSSNSLNFFMRSNWQRIWWKYLHQGDLRVMTFRDDRGALQGVAPLFAEADSQGHVALSVIGCVEVTDYIDLISAPGREQEITKSLLDFLCSADAPAWDSLRICNVPDDSPTLRILPQAAAECGCKAEVSIEDVCPVIDLPDSYEGYLELLDKKQRHELRRKRRRAEAHPVGWYVVGSQHNLAEEIEGFLKLMAMSTPDKMAFLQMPGHRDFFIEIGSVMFEQGLLDLSFLTIDGQRAAAMWNFAYGDRMMLYNSGLNPVDFGILSPGIVLLTFNIEHTIQRGFKKYDFLQGHEEYKFRMGAHRTSVHNLLVHR